jgi:hypothetical protein
VKRARRSRSVGHRRWLPVLPLLLAAACGGPQDLGDAGSKCFRDDDCQAGLICVAPVTSPNSRVCGNDPSSLVSNVDGPPVAMGGDAAMAGNAGAALAGGGMAPMAGRAGSGGGGTPSAGTDSGGTDTAGSDTGGTGTAGTNTAGSAGTTAGTDPGGSGGMAGTGGTAPEGGAM